MRANTKTKQELLHEMEELRTKLDATEQRLQEANEILQAEITERKRAEDTFEKAQKYATSIVETIREPLLVLTADLKVISANQSFYQTFQVAPKETEGRFVYSIGNHQWDIPALRRLLEEIVPQNSHFNDFEVDHKFPAIGRRRMLLNARRIYRQGKGTEMILLAIEDITERKQTEEALEVSEVRFRRLFETAQDGILILDADTGHISNVNPFLMDMLGYGHGHFLGKKLWEIGAFKDIDASKSAFSELQTKGYVRYEDLPLQTKDGRLIDVEFVSNVYLVDHKKVIQCNIRDITQRKWAEEESKTILRTAMDGFWLTNAQGNFLDVNDAYCRLIGYSHDELLTMGVHDVEAMETSEQTEQHIRRLKDIGCGRFETRHRCKDGRIVDLEVSTNYIESEGGRFFVFLRNITERKQSEEAIRQALRESQQRQAEISALLEGSRAVLEHHKFKDAGRAIFDSCKNLIGATAGYVALLSKDEVENEVLFLDPGGFLAQLTLPFQCLFAVCAERRIVTANLSIIMISQKVNGCNICQRGMQGLTMFYSLPW